MSRVLALLRHPSALRRVALASLAANVGLVITGGAVRLTGSGLGCPTWPRCTADSYTTTAAMGVHGVIEYTNRTLTGVVGLPALVGLVVALVAAPRRRATVALSAAVLAGIPAQAVLGGFTVLTHLNPWLVALHFLLSMAVIATAYALYVREGEADAPPRWLVPAGLRALGAAVVAVSVAVLAAGTVVTGSGPHAGDARARRTGLDPGMVAQLHTDLVFLLVGLSVAMWLAVRAAGTAGRAAGVLVLVEFAQGLIGFVQYFTHLPVILVGAHMAGAAAVWLATLAMWVSLRDRRRVPKVTAEPVCADPRKYATLM